MSLLIHSSASADELGALIFSLGCFPELEVGVRSWHGSCHAPENGYSRGSLELLPNERKRLKVLAQLAGSRKPCAQLQQSGWPLSTSGGRSDRFRSSRANQPNKFDRNGVCKLSR